MIFENILAQTLPISNFFDGCTAENILQHILEIDLFWKRVGSIKSIFSKYKV